MTTASPSPLAWALLCLLGLIWGASFLGVEMALTGFGPLTVAALRITTAAIILIAVAMIRGDGLPPTDSPRGRRIWLHCLGMAVFSNALPFSLLSWGQEHVTSGYAGITMAVVPLLVLPLAPTTQLREHLLLRLLANRACVQQEYVGLLRDLGLRQAMRFPQHVRHLGGVVLVHLTTEGLDVELSRHIQNRP